jgi:hypothetical protein
VHDFFEEVRAGFLFGRTTRSTAGATLATTTATGSAAFTPALTAFGGRGFESGNGGLDRRIRVGGLILIAHGKCRW